MLSNRPPQSNPCHGVVQSKEVPPSFLEHNRYRFEVVLNPCRRDSQSRKMIPLKTRESILEWFQSKSLDQWGFDLNPLSLDVSRVKVLRFQKSKDHLVTLGQATVQGELVVQDRSQFQKSFEQGIGKSRTFGCGLLQVVPMIHTSLF